MKANYGVRHHLIGHLCIHKQTLYLQVVKQAQLIKFLNQKKKLLQKNAFKESLFLLLCGLNWSNLSNLFAGLEFEFC